MGKWKFTDWYDQNKDKLNTQRKTRYHTDPVYREQIKAASNKRRESLRTKLRTERAGPTVCELLGISPWLLSRWKTLGYVPVDDLKNYQFTENQISLLGVLRDFQDQNKGNSPAVQEKRSEIVQVVHHNWGS